MAMRETGQRAPDLCMMLLGIELDILFRERAMLPGARVMGGRGLMPQLTSPTVILEMYIQIPKAAIEWNLYSTVYL